MKYSLGDIKKIYYSEEYREWCKNVGLLAENVVNLCDYFEEEEPLSPQEEVEELTEGDFLCQYSRVGEYYLLSKQGRDKLIRIINRRGKGENKL